MAKQKNPITWGTTQTFTKNFSSSAQTITLTGPTKAQGTVTYELLDGPDIENFTLSGLTLTIKANTKVDKYVLSVIATAAGNSSYDSGMASSTISITINKINPTLSVTGKTGLKFTNTAQALVSSWSVTGGGKVYLGLGSSASSAPSSWSTNTSPTATNAGTYYIWAKADASTNYNAVSQVYKVSVSIAKITPTLSVTGASLNYNGSAQTLVSAASVTGGGTIHYGLGSSATSAPSSWSTTKPTATNVGSYYIWAKSDASTNYSAVSQVYKATATIKPVMYLKFHANGGTIKDSPHKYSDTQYFKLNNSIVQGCSTASGTFTDITYTINTSTTYLNVWNITSYNITRPGYSYSGTTAFNTAANGTGINVNQDNTAAGDTNPITTKRLNGGTEITANVTKTLYIKWSANTYTITLNANGGSGGSTSVQITYGTAKGSYPSITKPTRTGYTFNGFYSATSGGTQWYDANGNSVREFNLTANTTWYAQWTINSYTLTINPNGGSWGGTTASSTATQNYATTKSIAAPTRAGYTFVGWAETGVGHLSKINQTDPAFDSSSGGVAVYNNSGGDTVTHTRQSSSAGAAYGSYEILIKASSGTTSPGNGGFYQPTTSAANQKYIHVFVAKIPTGYTVQHAQNATGDGRTITWLTSRKGTGAYQIYAYQHNCGSSGTFSTFGHVYLDTGSRPVSWQLAYSAMINITNGFADTYTYGAGAGKLTALWAPIVPMHVNVNGTWKTGPVWLNINGTWKQALEGYVNVNGTWKQIK